MKINHQRNDLKRQDFRSNFFFRTALLKHESNRDRRRMDRNAILRTIDGDDGTVFALNHMGNPWHWD